MYVWPFVMVIKKKSSDIVTQTPTQSVLLWAGGRAFAIQCLSPLPAGPGLQETPAGCESHNKSPYCLSQDSGEEGRGSRHEKDLLWGSSEMGFKG